jgi:hypothetical protein
MSRHCNCSNCIVVGASKGDDVPLRRKLLLDRPTMQLYSNSGIDVGDHHNPYLTTLV